MAGGGLPTDCSEIQGGATWLASFMDRVQNEMEVVQEQADIIAREAADPDALPLISLVAINEYAAKQMRVPDLRQVCRDRRLSMSKITSLRSSDAAHVIRKCRREFSRRHVLQR